MKITKRRVNKKRRVVGYCVGNRWLDLQKCIRLAKVGKISGVKVVSSSNGTEYLKSTTKRKLSDLPTVVIKATFPSHRIITPRQHTAGYIVDNKAYLRDDVVKMAKSGKILFVDTAKVNGFEYPVAKKPSKKSLYDLPTKSSYDFKWNPSRRTAKSTR